MQIVPSILSDSTLVIQEQLDRIAAESQLHRVQIDIVDPDFADEITVSPIDLVDLNWHGFIVDIHLMTNDPINDVVECLQVPGVSCIIGQIERMPSQADFIEHVKSNNLKVGLSVDLSTSFESVEEAQVKNIDALQVMDIRAGAQGRDFGGELALTHIRQARELLQAAGKPIELLVDGGINVETAKQCLAAGADTLIVGSLLWNSPKLVPAIAALQAIA